MGTPVLGWILIVIGIVALVAGIAGALAKMFAEIKKDLQGDAARARGLGGIELPTEFMKALTEFMKALAAAPLWLALTIIGIFLIGWGGTMIA